MEFVTSLNCYRQTEIPLFDDSPRFQVCQPRKLQNKI